MTAENNSKAQQLDALGLGMHPTSMMLMKLDLLLKFAVPPQKQAQVELEWQRMLAPALDAGLEAASRQNLGLRTNTGLMVPSGAQVKT